jgi:DNA-binding response OmpR family regulator
MLVERADTSGTGPVPAAGRGGLPLLAIDDDTVHRMIICRIAAKAGFQPTGAASYEEAVRLLGENIYAAITLDLSLGKHDGVEVLRFIAAQRCKPPIIIISSMNEATRKESVSIAEFFELNIRESLPKPVDLGHLRETLTQLGILVAPGASSCSA